MQDHWQMYVDGEFCAAACGHWVDVIDPATEEVITRIPYDEDGSDVARAISSAANAFEVWRQSNAWERGAILHRTAELMRERADDIARTMSRELGKPVPESRGEVLASAAQFEWFSEEAKRVYGRWVPASKVGARRWVLKEPLGVCAAVTAWNFPVLLPARKIAAATAAGCTIVARPSTNAPLSACEMVGCMHDAGIPPGVVNLVMGPASVHGAEFVANPVCRKISFTGSTDVGRKLMRGSSDQLKRLSLELGGSAPVLVFPDVDVDRVAEANVRGKFRNNGQVCIAATRFYVHESIYEQYLERVVFHTERLRVGNPAVEEVECGPLYDASAVDKMEGFVSDATSRGSRVLTGGRRPEGAGYAKGFWYLPTVLVDVPPVSRLTCEEVFGPIMPIFPFSSQEEVLQMANDTPFGLAAYVFTNDLNRSIEVCEALQFGIIGLNDMTPAAAECPFGGMKQSGMGREGGAEGIEEYLDVKYVSVGMGS